jgi:hypothetical protein
VEQDLGVPTEAAAQQGAAPVQGPAMVNSRDPVLARHTEVRLTAEDKIRWIAGVVGQVDIGKGVFDWASVNLSRQRTAKFYFKDFGTKWKRGHANQKIMEVEKILELNEVEEWASPHEARSVLNWRHHDHPLNRPGTQWEHIIEKQQTG